MKGNNKTTECMAVGNRTRKQRELREMDLRHKNKIVRHAARTHCLDTYNNNTAQNKQQCSTPPLTDHDCVKVVDESEFLKRTSTSAKRDDTGLNNADAALTSEQNSDSSIQIVAERWNPFGAPFDNDTDTDTDEEEQVVGFHAGPSKPTSEAEAVHGSETSDDDHLASDEDFRYSASTSDSSDRSSSYVPEMERKGKGKSKVLDEDVHTRVAINEEMQSQNECDPDYFEWLRCHHGSNSKQGENDELFSTSVNGGGREGGWAQKNRSRGYEESDDSDSDSDSFKDGSFIQSSAVPYCSSSKFGAAKKRGRPSKAKNGTPADGHRKRGRPRKNTCVNTHSESESENDPIGENWNVGESESESEDELLRGVHEYEEEDDNREIGMLPRGGDELYLKWLRSRLLHGRCEGGGIKKRGRPRKAANVGVGGCEKRGRGRGRPPKNGGDGKRGRGRPPKY